jgi:FMN reductase
VNVRVGVVVGNPKPASRTLAAATYVARALVGEQPELVVDLAELGAAVLDGGDPRVTRLVNEVAALDVLVVASPAYKGSYTGLLKVFLDQLPADGLRGVAAVPVMLGAGPSHAMAPEVHLRPVLTELGATVPVRGLYVLDSAYENRAAYARWLEAARPVLGAFVHARAGV